MPAGMITERYECRTGGHFKFWEVTYPNCHGGSSWWQVCFGRIGTIGQTKIFTELNWLTARQRSQGKIDEKISKGYIRVDQFSDPLPPKPQAANKLPMQKVKLTPAPVETKAKPKPLDETTKQIVVTLLKAGHNDQHISEFARCTIGQVKAIRANITMGKYEDHKPSGKPAQAASNVKVATPGKRKFFLNK